MQTFFVDSRQILQIVVELASLPEPSGPGFDVNLTVDYFDVDAAGAIANLLTSDSVNAFLDLGVRFVSNRNSAKAIAGRFWLINQVFVWRFNSGIS